MMLAFTNYLLGVLFLGALIPAIFKLVSCLKSFLRKRKLYYKFPQDPANPIFGHALQHPGPGEKGLAYQRKQMEKYPKCHLMWLMQTPSIIVHHPDTVKVILKTSEPKGANIYNMVRPWIGDGLFTSKGEKNERNRRLLTPAFHYSVLKNYIEVKNRCVDVLINKINQAAKESQPFLLFTNITTFCLDIILQCAMSETRRETSLCQGCGRNGIACSEKDFVSERKDSLLRKFTNVRKNNKNIQNAIYYLNKTLNGTYLCKSVL